MKNLGDGVNRIGLWRAAKWECLDQYEDTFYYLMLSKNWMAILTISSVTGLIQQIH